MKLTYSNGCFRYSIIGNTIFLLFVIFCILLFIMTFQSTYYDINSALISGNFRPENEWTRQAHLESVTKSGNYTDGSIESDLPMQQLSELFNVNHFIVSQVNAHSALLASISFKVSVIE